MEKLRVGDSVKVTDNSQIARLDSYEPHSTTEKSDEFEVLRVFGQGLELRRGNTVFHNIHIQSKATANVYLHSSSLVAKVETAKEMTVAEISKELGYTVKVVE